MDFERLSEKPHILSEKEKKKLIEDMKRVSEESFKNSSEVVPVNQVEQIEQKKDWLTKWQEENEG